MDLKSILDKLFEIKEFIDHKDIRFIVYSKDGLSRSYLKDIICQITGEYFFINDNEKTDIIAIQVKRIKEIDNIRKDQIIIYDKFKSVILIDVLPIKSEFHLQSKLHFVKDGDDNG